MIPLEFGTRERLPPQMFKEPRKKKTRYHHPLPFSHQTRPMEYEKEIENHREKAEKRFQLSSADYSSYPTTTTTTTTSTTIAPPLEPAKPFSVLFPKPISYQYNNQVINLKPRKMDTVIPQYNHNNQDQEYGIIEIAEKKNDEKEEPARREEASAPTTTSRPLETHYHFKREEKSSKSTVPEFSHLLSRSDFPDSSALLATGYITITTSSSTTTPPPTSTTLPSTTTESSTTTELPTASTTSSGNTIMLPEMPESEEVVSNVSSEEDVLSPYNPVESSSLPPTTTEEDDANLSPPSNEWYAYYDTKTEINHDGDAAGGGDGLFDTTSNENDGQNDMWASS